MTQLSTDHSPLIPSVGDIAAGVFALGWVAIATGTLLAPLCLGRDVAVVFVVLQLPWVLCVVSQGHRSVGRGPCFLAGLALLLGWGLGLAMLPALDRAWFTPLPGSVLRAAIAGGMVLGCGLIGWPMRRRSVVTHPPFWQTIAVLGVIAVVPPALFLHSRYEAEFHRVRDLLEQSRYATAARVLERLAWYPTNHILLGHDRRTVYSQAVAAERQVQAELTQLDRQPDRQATALDRARLLAMLGREPRALEVLSTLEAVTPEALNLRATIRETQEQWIASRDDYRAALALGDRHEPLAADRFQALRGIAYCERKLGNSLAAEAAWLRLVEIHPTAETHFLLGQFYEDTQQTRQARHHLHRAATLDPANYKVPAESIERRIRRAHLGCFLGPASD